MRKIVFLSVVIMTALATKAQQVQNIILITTDGMRWQDVFKGMDSAIANNSKYNEGDSAELFKHYWAPSAEERRKKLMPFLWGDIAAKGQVYGNRQYGNKVDNANPYWFSYPGYNEIMTGYPDTAINSNGYAPNPHITLPEFLNQQPGFKGKVSAFGAWEAFNRILNEERSGIPVVAAFDPCGGKTPTAAEKLINNMLADSYKPFGDEECLDVFTHYAAMENLRTKKPRFLYIAYGETDEWAHAGKYRSYLDAAHQVDAWLKAIWDFVQSDPQYKNKTAIFITTDHGRGDKEKKEWTSHNNKIADAYEIWFAAMGPGIDARGEMKTAGQWYQEQYAQTLAKMLGYTYTATHPIGKAIDLNKK